MQGPQLAPQGAQCAIHVDRSATHTCGRCGNFMCLECGENGSQAWCPTCRQSAGIGAFPFSRNDFDFSRVWDFAFGHWQREWVMLSVAVLIFFGVSMVGGVFSSIVQGIAGAVLPKDKMAQAIGIGVGSLVAQVVNVVVQGFVQLGLFRLVLDVLGGRKADVGRVFSQGGKLGRYVIQMLLLFLMIGLPVLLYIGALAGVGFALSGASMSMSSSELAESFAAGSAIVVMVLGMLALLPVLIYVSLPLQLAPMEIVYGDCDAMEALRRAWRMADGHRLELFGYGFIGGLLVLAGMLACCIGVLPGMALQQSLLVTLYLSLRTGMDFPPPPEP